MVEATGLGYKVRGQEILAGVDVSLDAGERLAVVGPSGSGKSTLLALIAGLAVPSSGKILVGGRPLEGVPRPSSEVAVVLQGYGLVSLLTAAENVEVALRAAGYPAAQAGAAARDALVDVGLEAHADQLVEELSGGQQQRTAVARALALRPRLLVADEPTAELDPAARTLVLSRLLEMPEKGGTLILATHDPEVAARCEKVLHLHAGTPSAK